MADQKNRVHRYLGAEIEVLVKYKCCGGLLMFVCASVASPRHARCLIALGGCTSLDVEAALAMDRSYGAFCAAIFTLEVPASG